MFKRTILLVTMAGLCHAEQDSPERGAPKESSPIPSCALCNGTRRIEGAEGDPTCPLCRDAPRTRVAPPQANNTSGVPTGGSRLLTDTVQQSVARHRSRLPPTMQQRVQQHAQILGGYNVALPGRNAQNGMPQGLFMPQGGLFAQSNAVTIRNAEMQQRCQQHAQMLGGYNAALPGQNAPAGMPQVLFNMFAQANAVTIRNAENNENREAERRL